MNLDSKYQVQNTKGGTHNWNYKRRAWHYENRVRNLNSLKYQSKHYGFHSDKKLKLRKIKWQAYISYLHKQIQVLFYFLTPLHKVNTIIFCDTNLRGHLFWRGGESNSRHSTLLCVHRIILCITDKRILLCLQEKIFNVRYTARSSLKEIAINASSDTKNQDKSCHCIFIFLKSIFITFNMPWIIVVICLVLKGWLDALYSQAGGFGN